MKKLLVLCLTLVLMLSAASAETILMYGTVVNTESETVTTTAEAVLESVNVSVGDHVSAGDVLAILATQKVYAPEDGTVYLFGTEGNSMADIAAKYGAVAYLAPAKPYSITVTSAAEVLPGEKVYLRCYRDGAHTGSGTLAKVTDTQFTVLVDEGEFVDGETVSIYRDASFAASRIGRGAVEKASLAAYTGEGYVVAYHVASGAQVRKGQLLYETICGTFAPGASGLNQLLAPVDGVVAAVDGSAFILYPDEHLRVVAYVPESVMSRLHIGDAVVLCSQYDENLTAAGTVENISHIPEADMVSLEMQYAVAVTVEKPSSFYYGMNVTVSPLDP